MTHSLVVPLLVILAVLAYYLIDRLSIAKGSSLSKLFDLDAMMSASNLGTDDDEVDVVTLQRELKDLRERVIVLERIVTDSAYNLNQEFKQLKD